MCVFFFCLGVIKYIGPVSGEKQSYVGLHLDSPGKLFAVLVYLNCFKDLIWKISR